MTRLVLLHGIATTARVWDSLIRLLESELDPELDVVALERPRTGDLDREVDLLAPQVAGSWVVGMSGGATLGLALAQRGVPLAGAILHEPAAGRLVPELFDPVVRAFGRGGTHELARTLYGLAWTPDLADGLTDAQTAVELAMFRSFEPAPLPRTAGRVVLTHGALSPPLRHRATALLREETGAQTRELPGVSHLAALDDARALLHLIQGLTRTSSSSRPSVRPGRSAT